MSLVLPARFLCIHALAVAANSRGVSQDADFSLPLSELSGGEATFTRVLVTCGESRLWVCYLPGREQNYLFLTVAVKGLSLTFVI